MRIAIIGTGYVGLVTGSCLAEVGHHVVCIDNDERKIKGLRSGRIPIYEPGLDELVHGNVSAHRLAFSTRIAEGVDNSEVIFIAVPTPPHTNGSVDLTYIERVAREIAYSLKEYRVIVDKSTVPVRTGEKVADTIRRYNRTGAQFDVVSNPEFLREGCALTDLMEPDRIVIGCNGERALAMPSSFWLRPRNAMVIPWCIPKTRTIGGMSIRSAREAYTMKLNVLPRPLPWLTIDITRWIRRS